MILKTFVAIISIPVAIVGFTALGCVWLTGIAAAKQRDEEMFPGCE